MYYVSSRTKLPLILLVSSNSKLVILIFSIISLSLSRMSHFFSHVLRSSHQINLYSFCSFFEYITKCDLDLTIIKFSVFKLSLESLINLSKSICSNSEIVSYHFSSNKSLIILFFTLSSNRK